MSQQRTIARPALILALVLTLALLALASPTLLWAYHLTRAGALLDTGLAWPMPQLADSLPTEGDSVALGVAQQHLAAAERWRPDHPYAYRLAGRAALARGDWRSAAESLEEAAARAPRNPLIGWELGLAYEQLWRGAPADSTLRDSMLAAWRGAGFDAATFETRAAEAQAARREDEAQVWRARAALLAETALLPGRDSTQFRS